MKNADSLRGKNPSNYPKYKTFKLPEIVRQVYGNMRVSSSFCYWLIISFVVKT